MKYKLYNSEYKNDNLVRQVLYNRGINDIDTYLNLDESVVNDYNLLDNINDSIELFDKHFQERNCIGIIPDSDVDGQCSSAELYLYIKRMDKDYPIKVIYHSKPKAHGLKNLKIPEEVKLLIVADAGTNDVEECKVLREKGIDIIILDHHEKEEDNSYAIIVNNQCSEKYLNKQLCGGGIVYRWLQALDDYYWNDFADDYLDLVAFSNISDVMDLREFETRYFVNCGLSNIQNKFLKTLIQSQDYFMNGKINIHNVQWYLTPLVNALLRIGSQDERKLLFKAFIEQDEIFEYKTRHTKNTSSEIIQETIYERVVRYCKNSKSKQDRLREKSVSQITDTLNSIPLTDKVIMLDVSNILEGGLSGVVAVKIAELCNRPCILLSKYLNKETGKITYRGSARNINYSPIESFKDVVNETKVFNFGIGHANAFGVSLDLDKRDEALNAMNKILKDVEYDSTYRVDFILDEKDTNVNLVLELNQLENLICYGIEEPMLAIENINLSRDCFEIYGKNEDVLSFFINDVKCIQFKCKEGNQLYDWVQNAWDNTDEITFTIVGTPSINVYNGIKTPQIVIKDVNVDRK